MTTATWTFLLGLLLLFLGERTLDTNDSARLILAVLGILALGAALVLRIRQHSGASEQAKPAHRKALNLLVLSIGGLLLYGLSLDSVVEFLSLGDNAATRWQVVLGVLWPIVLLCGAVPMILLDRAILAAPVSPHEGRARQAIFNGIGIVLALSMLFPLNYLAKELNHRWDLTYFQTAMPGSSTRAIVRNLEEPIRAVLFFPASNDVAREVIPYFEALEGPSFTVELVDHAMEPALAKEMKIRDNGNVALVQGESSQTIKLGTDIDKAKRTLKKLDSEVQKSLLKLSRGSRLAYFTGGHGEFAWRGESDPSRKLGLLKKILEALNFRVKELGLGDGLANQVPDDADIVFIVGPDHSFLKEEIDTIQRYWEGGGKLFVALEPGHAEDADFSPILELLGVSYLDDLLVTDDERTYLPITGGKADRQNLGTNRYSSHESVTTLSRASKRAWMVFPGAGSLEELDGHRGKVTVTVRTLGKVWADLDGNFEFDKDSEARKVRNLALVASGPAELPDAPEYRAVVAADATFLSDLVLANQPNAQFVVDATHWLAEEEDIAGSISNEEDVKIVHSKEGQGMWFYGTTFLVPLAIGLFGWGRVRSRRKQQGAA